MGAGYVRSMNWYPAWFERRFEFGSVVYGVHPHEFGVVFGALAARCFMWQRPQTLTRGRQQLTSLTSFIVGVLAMDY